MTNGGFHLTRVALLGTDVPTAEVTFARGLNVITGPSNTGKTFIYQCIDYAFGAKNAPKPITQAIGYTTVEIGIRAIASNVDIVIARNLQSGKVLLRVPGHKDRSLGQVNKANTPNNLSQYLLQISQLTDKKIRFNDLDVIHDLSFRNVVKLLMVDEVRIFGEGSPIFSGNSIEMTAEHAVFKLMLTGIDDSSLVARVGKKEAKVRRIGRNEVLETLLSRARNELLLLQSEHGIVDIDEELKYAESGMMSASDQLTATQIDISNLEEQRITALSRLMSIESRIAVLIELRNRFQLLKEQYNSDLRRLASIIEVNEHLDLMPVQDCPLCGSAPQYHGNSIRELETTPQDMAASCRAEVRKIQLLLIDLEETLDGNDISVLANEAIRDTLRRDFQAIQSELDNNLKPRVEIALQKFAASQSTYDTLRAAANTMQRINEYEQLLANDSDIVSSAPTNGVVRSIEFDVIKVFCGVIESLLESWRFPNLGKIDFDASTQDLIISDQSRANHGKGVRAITNSAFIIGLLDYCHAQSRPHPGLVIIDSPLVVYEKPDAGEEGFTNELRDAFYDTLANKFNKHQIIIFENEKSGPSQSIKYNANIIRFTGTNHGRTGFIPNAFADVVVST